HFVGAQCDRADPLDHGQNSPILFPCAVCSRHLSSDQNKAECGTHGLPAASWINWIRNFRNRRSRFMGKPTRTVEVKRISHQEAYPPNALNKTSTSPTFTASCVPFQQVGMRSEFSVISAGRAPQFRESSDEPSPFVDIELH
ncbi:MAG TPA: hypothetical protein VK567_12265, partial [Bradyrhizobium sp.]|nr:hypothetical protein [Bradyrhizobium sp.]